MRERVLAADAQHRAHHQPHRGRHAVAVAEKLGVVGDAHRVQVGAYALHQRQRAPERKVHPRGGGQEVGDQRAGGGEAPNLILQPRERNPRQPRVAPVVAGVVDEAAEGVHQRGVVARAPRKEPRREPEGAGPLPEHRARGVAHPAHAATPRPRAAGTGTGAGGAGTTRSSTRALDSTPGIPAPGCVPEPTRKSPPTCGEALW